MSETQTKKNLFSVLFVFVIIGIALIFYLVNSYYNIILWILGLIFIIYLLFKLKIILTLKDYERAVIYRFGKVNRVGGPGWILKIPLIEKQVIVSLRVETIDIPPQDVLTKDNIQLKIDGVLFISVDEDKQSVINSVVKVKDYRRAATMYVIAVLRDVVGDFVLNEVITNIETINTKLKDSLKSVAQEWGIKVTSVEISEIKIPQNILTAMHKQKAAVQDKLAVYEMAESEKAKIMAVKEATDQLSEKTVIYYYMQALEKMAQGQSSKIIFPMELTNILSKVSGNITSGVMKQPNPEKLEQGLNEEKLEKYLPLIKSYLEGKKPDVKTEKKNEKKSS